MSINENGHYHPTALPVRAGIPNAHVSSGCIRMLNEDVEHLYSQVKVGTKVKVR
ncbi:L,D-transpeptidase [Roseibium sp. TrichSKD4]|uniref:L,D-transpeptidase n=1 Tax=Roseibium sp. TrichSKD4 TaxID=744980 RepID=UPI002110577A|nr:L,D-transpeptidase family protein [Roseibium sp. TrichSKD4]